ncbi:MAG: hypothetical protein FWD75_04470 [Propionibacteriaceae bacterium]|nr:hypothetical protein [Propionibacteriaceae bacterium]
MNFEIPEDIVQAAEGHLGSAHNDVTSLIDATRTEAVTRLNDAIGGETNLACTELVTTWTAEVNQVVAMLAEFSESMVASGARTPDTVDAESQKITATDAHAARLG